MSVQLPDSFAQLCHWTSTPLVLDNQEIPQKIWEVYQKCQEYLTNLAASADNESKKRVHQLVQYTSTIEMFLHSKTAQSIFPRVNRSIVDEQALLLKKENQMGYGLSLLPRIGALDFSLKEKCLLLLPVLQNEILLLLDILEKDPHFGTLLLNFLQQVKEPKQVLKTVVDALQKVDEALYKEVIFAISFEDLYFHYHDTLVLQLCELYQKDRDFAKTLIFARLENTEDILKLAKYSIPSALRLTRVFSMITPECQSLCRSSLWLYVQIKEGSGRYCVPNYKVIENIVFFIEWIAQEKVTGKSERELTQSIEKAKQLLKANEPIGILLLGLPLEYQTFGQKIVEQTSHFKELSLSDIENVFVREGKKEFFFNHFEPWNSRLWIDFLSFQSVEIKNLLSSWIKKLGIPDLSALPLKEQLTQLPVEFRKTLAQLVEVCHKNGEILKPFLMCAQEHPQPSFLDELLGLIINSPEYGPGIIKFIVTKTSPLSLLINFSKKYHHSYTKILPLLNTLDPLLIDFIIPKPSEKLFKMAQTKPDLLAALIEIKGMVGIDCTDYLINSIDEKSAAILLHHAAFRHQLLPHDSRRIISSDEHWHHEAPFSLVIQALNVNRNLTFQIVELTHNTPSLMKQLLQEMLSVEGKKEEAKPLYRALLELQERAKTKSEKQAVQELLVLFHSFDADKNTLAPILLQMGEKYGISLLTNLLKFSESHRPLLMRLIKQFPESLIRERILTLASPTQVALLEAFFLLNRKEHPSFFERCEHNPTFNLQEELLSVFFPTFPPYLETWGEKLFSLYELQGSSPQGKALFMQLPQEARDFLFEYAVFLTYRDPQLINLFKTWILHFPSPASARQFLKAADSKPTMLSKFFNYMIQHPNDAPSLIEKIGQKNWSWSWLSWSQPQQDTHDVIDIFLIKNAYHFVEKLEDLPQFYWKHTNLINTTVQNPQLSESEKLEHIYRGIQPQIQTNYGHESLINQCKTLFVQPSIASFILLIQNGYAKEVDQLIKLCKAQGVTPLIAALLKVVAAKDGKFLSGCLQIVSSSQGKGLLDLLVTQIEPEPLLKQLINVCAAGHKRLVHAFLPVLKERTKQPFFLKLIQQNEGAFAEMLLERKGEYPEEILTLESVAIQKELFFLARTASKKVWEFCFSYCKEEQNEKQSLKILGYIHHLVTQHHPSLERWIESRDEALKQIGAAVDSIPLEIDQQMNKLMEKHRESDEHLWEEKFFSIVAAHYLVTGSGTINFPLIELIQKSLYYQQQTQEKTSQAVYLDSIFALMKTQVDLPFRLAAIKAPLVPNSPPGQIVREICDLPSEKPLEDRHACIVVLSALMTRPRQSNLASCFGTSILIQMHSNPATFVYLLEDYASLITKGKITRSLEKNGNVASYDFPLRLFPSGAKEIIEAEHPLVKALEFLIASMESKAESLVQESYQLANSWGMIGIKLWGINYRNQQKHLEKFDRNEILRAIQKEWLNSVDGLYDPLLSYQDERGGFTLADRETQVPIHTHDQYRDLWVKVIKKVQTEIAVQKKCEKSGLERTFAELITWMAGDTDQADSFLGVLSYRFADKGINSLYLKPTGGSPQRCRYIYLEGLREEHYTQRISLRGNSQDFYNFVQCMDQLPQDQKALCVTNPGILSPLGFSGHALSCMPGPLLQHQALGKTPDAIREELQNDVKKKGEYIPTLAQKQTIATQFIHSLSEENHSLIEGMVKESTLLTQEISLHQFANELLRLAQPMAISFESYQEWVRKLEKIIFTQISEVKYHVLPIGDCNWNHEHSNMLLALGYSLITGQLQTYISTHNLKVLHPYKVEFLEIYTNTILPNKSKAFC
jgi:hypothetical protein